MLAHHDDAEGMTSLLSGDEQRILVELTVALAIGLLFGLERGWHGEREGDNKKPAGVRTFGLIGLLGGVGGVNERLPECMI